MPPVATSTATPALGGGTTEPTKAERTPDTALKGSLRTVWLLGVAVVGAQFVLLMLHSWYLWDHFDLTADFGQYSQAWQQIATGHLNPYDTTYPWFYPHYGYPFYQGDLELIMWPLAPLYWVWPHAIDLLIVQDVALAGSGLCVFRWSLEHLQTHAPNRRFAVAVSSCVLAIVVLQPWTYWAASYDYHSEPLATFFTLLAGRDFWNGRRRGWIWVVFVLLCGNVATSYIAALGIAAIVSGRHRWRMGVVLVFIAVVWLGVVGLVHSGNGAALGAYAYLAHRMTVNDTLGGIFTIVTGVVRHPGTAAHVLDTRWGQIYKFVGGVGTVGVFSCVGAVFSVIVLAPSALNSSPGFISDVGGSQNIMAVMACAVGIAMLATWLTRQGQRRGPLLRIGLIAVALALSIGAVAQTAVESAHWTPLSGQTFERVDSAAAGELASVSAQIPGNAETIVSQGVVGRFAQRHVFYPYLDVFADGQSVPLFGHVVYVVLLPNQGLESAPASGTMAAIALMHRLGARQITDRHGVYAFEWHVPPGKTELTFPPP